LATVIAFLAAPEGQEARAEWVISASLYFIAGFIWLSVKRLEKQRKIKGTESINSKT